MDKIDDDQENVTEPLLSDSKPENPYEPKKFSIWSYGRRFSPRTHFFLIVTLFVFLFFAVNKYFTVLYSLDQIQNRMVERYEIETKVEKYQNFLDRYACLKEKSKHLLFPEDTREDRIIQQLIYVPSDYNFDNMKMKKIFRMDGPGDGFGLRLGTTSFKHCPVKSCYVSNDHSTINENDAFIFNYNSPMPIINRQYNQIFILHFRHAPFNCAGFLKYPHNWTVSYRLDSDIPIPFGKWVYHDSEIIANPVAYKVDDTLPKSRMAAIILNDCDDHNGRSRFIEELQEFIEVDIYGVCGTAECPEGEKECWKHIERNYKFYLSFENSNCQDYITDKNFFDVLNYDVIPVVMGAKLAEYSRLAPKKSFIHVDEFTTTKQLAVFLKKVAQNSELYDSYFQWRGTGEFIDTHFPCRLCAMLHNPSKMKKSYPKIKEWWLADHTCVKSRWQNDIEWANEKAYYNDF